MPPVAPSNKKKIVRKKPGTGPSKVYFDQETQEAIVKFQDGSITLEERNKVYTDKIQPAFDALVQNLINVYGYHVSYDSKDDLKNECVEFLFGVITKFDNSKGSKAFSYFNVVAMHWLTIRCKTSAKSVQLFTSIDNKEKFSAHDLHVIENHSIAPSPDEVVEDTEEKRKLNRIIEIMNNSLTEEHEQACLSAIKAIVTDVDDIDIINRRAILIYLKNVSQLNPKKLTQALSRIRKYYPHAKQIFYREEESEGFRKVK